MYLLSSYVYNVVFQGHLSDNKWHTVIIGRPSRYKHTLMVDGHIATATTRGDNYHLDLDGILYLGNLYTFIKKPGSNLHETNLASLNIFLSELAQTHFLGGQLRFIPTCPQILQIFYKIEKLFFVNLAESWLHKIAYVI